MDYRTEPLPEIALEKISERLERAESAGLKSVVRFQYSNAIGAPDAPQRIMLHHVEQLADIFERYLPSIAVVQAGFIGAWGEWHSSTNGLDSSRSYRALIQAMLQAVPVERCIQVRTPRYKREVAGLRSLCAERAFDGSAAARIGLHNDCFLSGEDDSGTYAPPYRTDRRWAASEGLFVPVGGETCRVSPRASSQQAITELRQQRFSFLSQDWHPDVIALWEGEGALSEVEKVLGYRFVITQIDAPNRLVAGERLSISLRIANTGAAAPYNPRPVLLLLEQGDRRIEVPLRHADPRHWLPGTERQLACAVTIPESFIGSWRVSLWLPDGSERLRHRPEYALQFANEATWDPTVGTNVLNWLEVVQP